LADVDSSSVTRLTFLMPMVCQKLVFVRIRERRKRKEFLAIKYTSLIETLIDTIIIIFYNFIKNIIYNGDFFK
jgi:hypothetical protein